MNKCKYCGTTEKLKKDKRMLGGVMNVCYACHYKKTLERHPDYNACNYKKRLEKHPDWNALSYKKARETDPDYVAKKSAWWKTEKGKECIKRHNATESYRVISRNAAAKRRVKKGLIVTIDKEQMKWFYSAAKKISVLQGKEYQVDHIHPLARGGDHSLENVQLLEHKLNTIKNDKLDTGITGCTYQALKNALSHIGEIKC